MPTNLYQGKEYFLLRINGTETFIDEPVNWDKVLFKAERDKEFYGFNAEFIDGDIQLLFAYDNGGGNELDELYETEGADGVAELEFGLLLSNSRDMQCTANVNLNTRVEKEEGVECAIEKVTFESLFRTRYTTKVSLNSSTSYDGDVIPGAASVNLLLHSKSLIKKSEAKSESAQISQADPVTANAVIEHFIQPDTSNLTIEELDEMESMPFAITEADPFSEQRYQYKAEEAGFLEIKYDWYMSGGPYYISTGGQPVITSDLDGTFGGASATPMQWSMFVWVERGGVVITQQFQPAAVNRFPKGNTFTVDIEKDDQVYVGIKVIHNTNTASWYTDSYVNTLTFKQYTVAPASNCTAYRIIDFLNYLVAAVTGKNNRVISNFYGTGGPAEHFCITSGYAIRKFDVSAEKPVQCDLDTALSGLADIHNIGVGFKTVVDQFTGLNEHFVFIEPMSYFYRKGVIVIIKEAYDWVERHDKAHTYNQVAIGYDKYPDKQLNTLDEFNTEQEWLLPIKTYKNTLTKKSSLIASGALLEIQRREQFKENPSTSLEADDRLFIVAYTPVIEYPETGYVLDQVNGKISFSRPVGLVAGTNFKLVAAGIYLHVASIDFTGTNSYNVTGSFPTQAGVDTVEVIPGANADGSVSNAFAERNQYFSQVDNVIDPASSYNLRITPKRNFYNFAPLLNIGMEKKDGGLYIRNTFSKNNGDLITKMQVGAPNIGDVGTREIVEKTSILLSDFNRDSRLFTAKEMEFKARMSYDDVKRIKAAMRDELDAEFNCGCIVAPDKSGQLWICTITSMTYNYVNEEAQFVTNKVELY